MGTGRGRTTGCTHTTTRSERTTICQGQVTLSPRLRRLITACLAHSASLRGLLPTPSLDSRSLATLRTHLQPGYELMSSPSTTKIASGQTKSNVCHQLLACNRTNKI